MKKDLLINLFENWSKEKAIQFYALPQSGSYREYYRIKGDTKTALGVFNPDKSENIAFLSFTKTFLKLSLPVPEIYSEDLDKNIYLIEDLGDTTLFSYITEKRTSSEFPDEIVQVYRKVIEKLPGFQIEAAKHIDYSVCYPRSSFDKQSMMWDLNYFKYYFLKLGKIQFDEQLLESDFHTFSDYLLKENCDYFLYRDFQSRNIMLKDGEPYFIDYQGGRKGALHYDIASLLYDAKADLPQNIRADLLDYYIQNLKKYIEVDDKKFVQMFFGYVLIRIMQAMGAYGFRGFYEKKEHFLKSIPYAIENLKWLLANVSLPIKIPALLGVLEKIINSQELKAIGVDTKYQYKLVVTINSFSYRKSIPIDETGNGGGFVFDCRALHNPGRYDEYRLLTGKDEKVKKFLIENSEVEKFLESVFNLIKLTVDVYLKRKFTHLMVSFGCTGGQHRSVYCAERLAEYLATFSDVKVNLKHIELESQKNLLL